MQIKSIHKRFTYTATSVLRSLTLGRFYHIQYQRELMRLLVFLSATKTACPLMSQLKSNDGLLASIFLNVENISFERCTS